MDATFFINILFLLGIVYSGEIYITRLFIFIIL